MRAAILLGLWYGALLSATMSALVLVSLRQNPRIWLHDAPPDVRARLGPVDARTRRQRAAWAGVMLIGLVAIFAALAARTAALGPWATFVAAYVCFETFNLFDALVIDLGLIVFRPRWAFPPGAEDSPAYSDPRWHLRNWLIGVLLGLPVAGLVAAIAWLVCE